MNKLVAVCSVILSAQAVFAADWYAKETRWAGHDPDIIRYEDGYALATTDNHMLMQFSEDALNWKNAISSPTASPARASTSGSQDCARREPTGIAVQN